MKIQIPEYFSSMVSSSRDDFCDVLHNPALWSDPIIKKTLERVGSQAFNIEDVQLIIKDYLTVLAETIRKSESS